MLLDRPIRCATGLTIAGREAAATIDTTLRVTAPGPVATPGGPAIEAQLDGGVVWRRHWTVPGGMVVEFVDAARVAVADPSDDGRGGTVTFDRDLDPEQEEHLVFDHVLPLVLARRGNLVLHGGVISRHGRGVVLVGNSGAGKSTLTGYAWRRGWTVGGDDGAVISTGRPGERAPTAEPTYPTLRLTPSAADLLGIDAAGTSPIVGKLRVDERAVPDGPAFLGEPVPLTAVVIVEPARGTSAVLDELSGFDAHAELFGSTFHADFSAGDQLPAVVRDLASIVEDTTVTRLQVPRGRIGLEAAETALRALVERSR